MMTDQRPCDLLYLNELALDYLLIKAINSAYDTSSVFEVTINQEGGLTCPILMLKVRI